MNEWTVTTLNGSEVVEAQSSEVLQSGVLVFIKNGNLCDSYAPGYWIRCVLKTEARHGYR